MTEITQEVLRAAYIDVFGGPSGQVVLADLLRRFGFVTRSAFAPGAPDLSAYQEGQRTVLIHVGRMLDPNTPLGAAGQTEGAF